MNEEPKTARAVRKAAASSPQLKSKLPDTGRTIFSIMSQMAHENNAINLSQGFPDFPVSPKLISLVNRHMRKGLNQYSPLEGQLTLRQKLAAKAKELYGAEFDPISEINITSGGTQAIHSAITATVSDGDEVIVFEPAYDCYVPAVKLAGGVPIFIPLTVPTYRIDWEAVKKRINHKTRMIIINTPNNPGGTVISADDMKQLEKLTRGSDILILSDEVYEHIIFDGLEHQSVLRYPGLRDRAFVVFSFGKTYHATGWKLGYCFARENLMREFRRVHQFVVFSSNTPLQHAFADYMDDKQEYLKLPRFYQLKRDYFLQALRKSRFKFVPSEGTYFQLLDYSAITDEDDMAFAERLTKEHGIASIPVSVFYSQKTDNKVLRFCFAKSNTTLKKAAQILCKL